jgi:hypothetical protein
MLMILPFCKPKFFLELWTEIKSQTPLRVRAAACSSLPDLKAAKLNADTIFDKLIDKYAKVVSRSEDMIVQQVCREVEGGLKAHFALA